MKNRIVSYNKEEGIIIDCTEIEENEHEATRKEIEKLGFSFDIIDSDSFRAIYTGDGLPTVLKDLENLNYSF